MNLKIDKNPKEIHHLECIENCNEEEGFLTMHPITFNTFMKAKNECVIVPKKINDLNYIKRQCTNKNNLSKHEKEDVCLSTYST